MNRSGFLKSTLTFVKNIPAAVDREMAVYERFEEFNAQYLSVEELKDRFHVPSFANKFYVVAQILNIKNPKEGGKEATMDYAARVKAGQKRDHKGTNVSSVKQIFYDRMVVFRYAIFLLNFCMSVEYCGKA
jgi:hypothetical protein